MQWNEYKDHVTNDIEQYFVDACWIEDFQDPDYNFDYNDFVESYDEASEDASGNLNGSYWFSREKAREAVFGIIFCEEFYQAAEDNGLLKSFIKNLRSEDPEGCDVVARLIASYEVQDRVQKWFEEQIGRELN